MEAFIMLWVVVDLMLFVITCPWFRNIISQQDKVPYNRSINSTSVKMEQIQKLADEMGRGIIITVIFYAILHNVDFEKILLEIYNKVFVIAIVPLGISLISQDIKKIINEWNVLGFLLGCIICLIGYFCNEEIIYLSSFDKNLLDWIIAIDVSAFIIGSLKLILKDKKIKKIQINIRKDLLYRTGNVEFNGSKLDLIKYSEMFFYEYIEQFKKVKHIQRVEYVNLVGKYQDKWYKRAAKYARIFILGSLLISIIVFCHKLDYKPMILIFLIGIYMIDILYLKKSNNDYLYRIAIRLFYEEWGYCLYYSDNCKFIGSVQLIESSKNHKYIHRFLDIVAFARVVLIRDELERSENIKILTQNFCELFDTQNKDIKADKEWVKLLPLWSISLIQYKFLNELEDNICKKLKSTINSSEDWADVSIFIQSFIVDMTRKMPNEDSGELLSNFMNMIKSAED